MLLVLVCRSPAPTMFNTADSQFGWPSSSPTFHACACVPGRHRASGGVATENSQSLVPSSGGGALRDRCAVARLVLDGRHVRVDELVAVVGT